MIKVVAPRFLLLARPPRLRLHYFTASDPPSYFDPPAHNLEYNPYKGTRLIVGLEDIWDPDVTLRQLGRIGPPTIPGFFCPSQPDRSSLSDLQVPLFEPVSRYAALSHPVNTITTHLLT